MVSFDNSTTYNPLYNDDGVKREGIEKYGTLMSEIKLRLSVTDEFLSGKRNAVYVQSTVESIGLQFRKIFETIALASLAANKYQYSKAYKDFAKHWEAAKILKALHKINPNFYPRPIIETAPTHTGASKDWQDRKEDEYLTQRELIISHGVCGSLMHGANPFGRPIDYAAYQEKFPEWRAKTINLLNSHQVRLAGDPGLYVFHMQEEGHDGVRWYRFEPYLGAQAAPKPRPTASR